MKLPKRESMWDFSEEPESKKKKGDDKDPFVEDKTPPVETIADKVDEFGGAIKTIETTDSAGVVEVKRKKKIPLESEVKEPELYIDFEDLDIDPPYVDDFKDEFGAYPVLSIRKFCKLPVRYNISAGKKRFKMQSFEVGQELKVSSMEAGKKVDYNIICGYRGDDVVLEPSMITKFCKIVNPEHSSFKTKSEVAHPAAEPRTPRKKREKIDPAVAKEFMEKIEQRKKEAKFSI